jgi:peptidoglycan-N-acetylglucosamine deacetylase
MRNAATLVALSWLLGSACAAPPPAPPPLASAPLAPPAPPAVHEGVEIAITVDDLPAHGPLAAGQTRLSIVDRLLAAFAKHRLPPVYGFVNGKKVDDDPALESVLRRWTSAGQPLGNHAWSHMSLNKASIADYLADIDKGEGVLQRLVPDASVWKVYRYPFLFEGDTEEKRAAVRQHLDEHGYTIAHVSIDADDWAFNAPFARCSEKGDAAALASLREDFVRGHVEELGRVRAMGRSLAGREVKHVLLLHAGVADADAIDALLTAYEREGARFVGLREALSDPFYAMAPGPPMRAGAAFPYRVAKARGLKAPPPVFARGLEERLDALCR